MELKAAFAESLKHVRLKRGLTQEDFSLVSSRTNISLLERAKTIPTLEKMEELCERLSVHPVSLLAACYMLKEGRQEITSFLEEIRAELEMLSQESNASGNL